MLPDTGTGTGTIIYRRCSRASRGTRTWYRVALSGYMTFEQLFAAVTALLPSALPPSRAIINVLSIVSQLDSCFCRSRELCRALFALRVRWNE